MKRAAGVALAVAFVLGGCTSTVAPTPTPASTPSPRPSPTDDGVVVLRFALGGEPGGFLPPATDPGAARIQALLYDALYRLDDRLAPVPELAAALPAASRDGKTWTIGLRDGVTFSDGSGLDAADVVTTLRLALSPACPFGDLCRTAAAVVSVTADDEGRVILKLRAPSAPLLAGLLAALPILPSDALEASLARLLAGAADIDRAALAATVERIAETTNAEACLVASPPLGCDPADHVRELESLLGAAGVALPEPRRFLDDTGTVDRSSYGSALLGAVRSLSDVLEAADLDRLASALPLLDLGRAPVGSGPYRLARYRPGSSVELERRDPGGEGVPQLVRAVVMRDPTEAVTALLSGEIDWLPDAAPELVPVLETDPTVRVAARPSGTYRAIVFNVRDGHPFADPLAREAFVRCLDREALVADATAGRGQPARGLVAPASWAFRDRAERGADAVAARALLETAGYRLGADGVYARDGRRLAGELLVRPGRADLAAMAAAAAAQLRGCGIELGVREVGFSPDVVLPQLEWPNAFETFLATLRTGSDPGEDLGWLASDRATGPDDPGDANFGGWRDEITDGLLAQGAATLDARRRRTAYGELQDRLADLVPVWPIAHEMAHAAVSVRLRIGDGQVDPSLMTYESGLREWRIAPP